jgi:hypothetical protein
VYGLEAIKAANGWEIALAGAFIVVSGLAVLAFIISLFPEIVRFMDRRKNYATRPEFTKPQADVSEGQKVEAPRHLPEDIDAVVQIYTPLIRSLEQPFKLAELYRIAQTHDFPHPHLTIQALRAAGKLQPSSEGEGAFTWKP